MELKKLTTIFEQLVSETVNSQLCWKKFDWDDPNSNPGIELMCSLGDFIHKENHVSAVKHQFLIYLNETKRVFEKYPIIMKCGS